MPTKITIFTGLRSQDLRQRMYVAGRRCRGQDNIYTVGLAAIKPDSSGIYLSCVIAPYHCDSRAQNVTFMFIQADPASHLSVNDVL